MTGWSVFMVMERTFNLQPSTPNVEGTKCGALLRTEGGKRTERSTALRFSGRSMLKVECQMFRLNDSFSVSFPGLAIKRLEALFYQRQQIGVADLQVMGGDDGAVDFPGQQIVAGGFGER